MQDNVVLGPTRPMVFVRFRPSCRFSYKHYKMNMSTGELRIRCIPHDKQDQAKNFHRPKTADATKEDVFKLQEAFYGQEEYIEPVHHWRFPTDGLLFEASQEEVYKKVCSPLVQRLSQGWSGTLLVNGTVGAGKSFTVVGMEASSYRQRGIIPRALEEATQLAERMRGECEVEVRMSFVEICSNDRVVDLLSGAATRAKILVEDEGFPSLKDQKRKWTGYKDKITDPFPALKLRYPKNKVPRLVGVKEMVVHTAKEALTLFLPAVLLKMERDRLLNRPETATTTMATIIFRRRSLLDSSAKPTLAKLLVVTLSAYGANRRVQAVASDLPPPKVGPHENYQKIVETKRRSRRDQSSANRSLVFLEQLLLGAISLRGSSATRKDGVRPKAVPVPVRSCALTALLAGLLDPRIALRILVSVRGEEEFVPYTLSALRNAVRARLLPYRPLLCVMEDPRAQLQQMEAQLVDLQEDLKLRDNLVPRPPSPANATSSSTVSNTTPPTPQLPAAAPSKMGNLSAAASTAPPPPPAIPQEILISSAVQGVQVEHQTRLFLAGRINEPEVRSSKQVRAVYQALRSAYRLMIIEKQQEVKSAMARASALQTTSMTSTPTGSSMHGHGGSDRKSIAPRGKAQTSVSSASAASGKGHQKDVPPSVPSSQSSGPHGISAGGVGLVGELDRKGIGIVAPAGKAGPAETSALLAMRKAKGASMRRTSEEDDEDDGDGEEEDGEDVGPEGGSGAGAVGSSGMTADEETALRQQFSSKETGGPGPLLAARLDAAETDSTHWHMQTVALLRRTAELKGEEESLMAELRVQQQERYLRGDRYDPTGQVILGEKERTAIGDLKDAEDSHKEAQRQLQMAQLRFSAAKTAMETAREDMKRAFEEFCKGKRASDAAPGSAGSRRRAADRKDECSEEENIFLYYCKKLEEEEQLDKFWREDNEKPVSCRKDL